MDTPDHHQLAKLLFVEAQQPRSNMKAILDLAEDRLTAERAIAVAHNSLSKQGHTDAIKKLLHYRNHYFPATEHHYPKSVEFDLKAVTEHSIAILSKWANEIEQAMMHRKPHTGFNRFIHRSVAALAKKVAQIEPLTLRQEYFTIAAYKINEAFMEHSSTVQSIIGSAIAKICAEMGVTDALLRLHEQKNDYFYRSSGVSLPLEIQNLCQVIDSAYQHYTEKTGILPSIYKAQIARVISSTQYRLAGVENMDTRYDYLSKAKNAVEKHIASYHENFVAIALHYLADLKDKQATEYRKNRNRAAKANNKAKIQLNLEQAKTLFADVTAEMIQQMQPSRYQSWAKLALAICLLTGRRIYEVCVTGNFALVNHNTLRMTGMAKQKNDLDAQNRSIDFRVYADANLLLWAIQTLRELKNFSIYNNDYEKFRKGTSTPLRHAVAGPKKMIEMDAITIRLQPKMMRQFYAAKLKYDIAQRTPGESDNFYDHELAKHLGHNADTDIETVQSYKDIVIVDPPHQLKSDSLIH